MCGDGVVVTAAYFGEFPGIRNWGQPRYLGEETMMKKTAKQITTAVGLLVGSAAQSVWAALPTPVAPSTAPAAGDWIGLIQGYIKDGGLVLGLAIAVIGFLWIAYLGFAKFNEARQGKAEWAEVGVLGIVGAVVLIFASFLLTEAAGVI
jgi:integrating conjugative element membrane protein (TIGR03745 family)